MSHIFFVSMRRIIMILTPLLLVVLEWNHPSGFSRNVYQGLAYFSTDWKYIHILQSFLFGGIAFCALLLTLSINNFWGILSKFFIWLFAVCYLVFDSTAGIAVGSIIETSQRNPTLDLVTVQKIVQYLYNDPVIGGSGSFFSLTASWSWLLGISTAIIALFFQNRELPLWKFLPPLLLLGISGYSLYIGHYFPYGPIAFSSFALASIWFEAFHFGPGES